jgi:hypothetical protein
VRVIDRVHRDTTDARTLAHVADAPGLAEVLVGIVGVRDSADGGHALLAHEAKFTRRQADLRVAAVTTDELGVCARGACNLAALAGLKLDIVDDGADGHAGERHRIARLDVGLRGAQNSVADGETLGREDVGLFAIIVADQRDKGGPVRIVFDPLDGRRDVHLGALEINDPVEAFCPATAATCRDPSGVVPAALFRQTLGEVLDGTSFPKLRTVDQHQPALARRRRFVRLECHAFCLPFASRGLRPLSVLRAPKVPGSLAP